ncbi:MAG: hypothetical protein ACQXXJ_03780 [Candidatus Bathyarchaeia archaeon]
MEASVAALILVVAAVVFSCLVVDYAVNIVEATLNTENIPQLARLREMQSTFLNETDALLNSTLPSPASSAAP